MTKIIQCPLMKWNQSVLNRNFKRCSGPDYTNKYQESLLTSRSLPAPPPPPPPPPLCNHAIQDTDRWPGCCWVAPRRRSWTAADWPPCRARPCCWRPCLSACRWRPARQRWWYGGRCLLPARADWVENTNIFKENQEIMKCLKMCIKFKIQIVFNLTNWEQCTLHSTPPPNK